MNDIVTNKIQSIQRCVLRAREEYGAGPDVLPSTTPGKMRPISTCCEHVVLRACDQAIDLANHIIKNYKMGIPTASAESFDLLHKQGVITAELAENLRRMVHFRNTVIHQYQRLDLTIVQTVIVSGLDDLIQFGDRVLEFIHGSAS